MKERNSKRYQVLYTLVDAVSLKEVVERIVIWAKIRDKSRYVCVTGVHGVMEAYRNLAIRKALNEADLNVPDGMPLVWLAHYFGFKYVDRVYGPDLALSMFRETANTNISHFFYGGLPGIADRLIEKMKQKFQIDVRGSITPPVGYFSEEEEKRTREEIIKSGADIIWIGLSTPKQELLMSRWKENLKQGIMIGVGAAFDFLSGNKRQAPLWMQKRGLEWLFRLLQEPRRLWKRYLVNNPLFICMIFMQLTGIKKYRI